MSKNSMTTDFLKECMADSLLKLMKKKDFLKITINEIAKDAGINRSTYFRNYSTKNEALTFKLIRLWNRWADEHAMLERHKYSLDNASSFFQFNYENREILSTICSANLQSVIYDAFYQIMMPQFGANAEECYQSRFFSYGLFGLLDEWIKRDFVETPEEMTQVFYQMMHHKNNSD